MLGFGFTFGSNFSFLSLKLIITRKHTQKQRKIRPRSALASNADALLARHATLPWAGTRDEPALRTSAWDATSTRILFASKIQCQRFSVEFLKFITKILRLFGIKMKSPREFPNESTSTPSTSFPGFSPTHPTEPFVGAGRREPCERDCYSMSSISWPDPTIVLNPRLETPNKKSFESKKSTLIYFRRIFLVCFCRTAWILALLFVRYLRPNPGVDKIRNTETFWNILEHEKIKIFFLWKKNYNNKIIFHKLIITK